MQKEVEAEEESELFGPGANGNHRLGHGTRLGSAGCCGNASVR